MKDVTDIARAYAQSVKDEQLALLKELGSVPSPTRHEDERAVFCRDWLMSKGARDVYIDDAKNTICRINYTDDRELIVFAAHTDIVFPDTEPLEVIEENGRLYAPGIGDDTGNLVNLLLCARYLLENGTGTEYGVLIVANSCEEGLGNLDGTKALFEKYGSRVKYYYSFDGYMPDCCCGAVGSHRYKVTCTTEGGHSLVDFGKPNAIEHLCRLVEELYSIEVPQEAKTTYNVGRFEGGTTVNTIAQSASMLYEFRSGSQDCLKVMEGAFEAAVEKCSEEDAPLSVELLGIRPGSGPIDADVMERFTSLSDSIIKKFCGEVRHEALSTDSNIPLSVGIPANTIGTVCGAGMHTREEWIDIASLQTGLALALTLVLQYAEC